MKKMELSGKRLLNRILRLLFHTEPPTPDAIKNIRKILVFRLDQRLGNGILLLPLLKSIQRTRPDLEVHLFLHYPVAGLIERFAPHLASRFWKYNQQQLLNHPLRFFKLLRSLRKEKYDLALSSHNPDNFSFSQALLGRWCAPAILAGFAHGDSRYYYDVEISSSPAKHYSDAQLDLWRHFSKDAVLEFGGLTVPEEEITGKFREWNMTAPRETALLWLGATGKKKLPLEFISFLYEQITKQTGLAVQAALGIGDRDYLENLPGWIRNITIVWDKPLADTAVFFSAYRLFVSADTGPMHLAAALGIPGLTLFSQSNINQYGYNDLVRHFSMKLSDKNIRPQIIDALQKLGEAVAHEN